METTVECESQQVASPQVGTREVGEPSGKDEDLLILF
ncbi:hypothetical protein ACP70R_011362 [Stipagrostis hirtigluma subsp. patula]